MFNEISQFLLRGDVLALAVAVIIGGAFQKIVDSLVANVIMPLLGMLTGGLNFEDSFQYGSGESKVKLGAFIQAIVYFIMIGVVLYFLVKAAGNNPADIK